MPRCRLLSLLLALGLAACSDSTSNIDKWDLLPGPDAGQPDGSTPEPDGASPDSAAPDIPVVDLTSPDASSPDSSRPDTSSPDIARPDLSSPDTGVPDTSLADLPTAESSVPDAYLGDLTSHDALVPDQGVPLTCAAIIGKPCTNNGGECGTSAAALCLLTTATTGVCTCACTPDDPQTPLVDEDSCPNAQSSCGTVELSGGQTQNLCFQTCNPRIGASDCAAPLSCDPRSGASIGLFDEAVCLFEGCTADADCPVITSTTCSTTGTPVCPSGEQCLPLVQGGTTGLCARAGRCDTTSGLCAPRVSNFLASARVGDPCADDTQCGANMACERQTTSGGQVHARNGYCIVRNCAFPTLTQFTCPAGSACNHIFTGGLCQKTCSLTNAADCRGHGTDKLGDYECRAWNNVSIGSTAVTTSPVCDFGDTVACDTFTFLGCDTFGTQTNPTNMRCRSRTNVTLAPRDPNGLCLDDSASGPVN